MFSSSSSGTRLYLLSVSYHCCSCPRLPGTGGSPSSFSPFTVMSYFCARRSTDRSSYQLQQQISVLKDQGCTRRASWSWHRRQLEINSSILLDGTSPCQIYFLQSPGKQRQILWARQPYMLRDSFCPYADAGSFPCACHFTGKWCRALGAPCTAPGSSPSGSGASSRGLRAAGSGNLTILPMCHAGVTFLVMSCERQRAGQSCAGKRTEILNVVHELRLGVGHDGDHIGGPATASRPMVRRVRGT